MGKEFFAKVPGAKRFTYMLVGGTRKSVEPTPIGGSEWANSVHCCPPPTSVGRVLVIVVCWLCSNASCMYAFMLLKTNRERICMCF